MRNLDEGKKELEKIHPELYDGYISLPRLLLRHYRNGTMIRNEYLLLNYLYSSANPFGKCFVTNSDIAEEVFGSTKKRDYARKLVGELKKKGYIHFGGNQGKRYKYEIQLRYFLTSGGSWVLPENQSNQSDVEEKSPNFQNNKLAVEKGNSGDEGVQEVRGDNNENDNENKNKNNNKSNIESIEDLRTFMGKKVYRK